MTVDLEEMLFNQMDKLDSLSKVLAEREHAFDMLQTDYMILQTKYDSALKVVRAAAAWCKAEVRSWSDIEETYDLETATVKHIHDWGKE